MFIIKFKLCLLCEIIILYNKNCLFLYNKYAIKKRKYIDLIYKTILLIH